MRNLTLCLSIHKTSFHQKKLLSFAKTWKLCGGFWYTLKINFHSSVQSLHWVYELYFLILWPCSAKCRLVGIKNNFQLFMLFGMDLIRSRFNTLRHKFNGSYGLLSDTSTRRCYIWLTFMWHFLTITHITMKYDSTLHFWFRTHLFTCLNIGFVHSIISYVKISVFGHSHGKKVIW